MKWKVVTDVFGGIAKNKDVQIVSVDADTEAQAKAKASDRLEGYPTYNRLWRRGGGRVVPVNPPKNDS